MATLQKQSYDHQGHYQRWRVESLETIIVDFVAGELSPADHANYFVDGVSWAVRLDTGAVCSVSVAMSPELALTDWFYHPLSGGAAIPATQSLSANRYHVEDSRTVWSALRFAFATSGGVVEVRTPKAVKIYAAS